MNSIRRRAGAFACATGVALAAAALAAQAPSHATSLKTGGPTYATGLGVPSAAAAQGAPLKTGGPTYATGLGVPSAAAAQGAPLKTGGPTQEIEPDRVFRFRRPILRIGQDYTLRAGEVVQDVRSVLGDVTLEGHVEQDVVVVLGTVHATRTAIVDGSLVVLGGSATIDQGATVRGDLVVVGGLLTAPPDFSPGGNHVVIGSPVLGNALNAIVPWIMRGLLWGRLIVPGLGWIWVIVGLVFLVYLAVNTLFDGPVRTSADVILDKPLSAFFVGLLVLVLTVPAIAILAATVIGLAVVPFVLCAMLVAGLVGKAGVARAIGRSLVGQSSPDSRLQSFRSFLVGAVVICLAYMVPVLGVVTWALTGVLGVGAAAVMLRVRLRREHPARERAVTAPAAVQAPAALGAEGAATSWSQPPLADATPVLPPATVAGDFALFPRATFLDRVAAFALDCLLVGIAVQVLDFSRHGGWFPLMLFAYHVAFWAWKGTTLGGIVVGLRVIRIQGTDVRFVDALVRGLASIFSLAALGIGCFWMLQDPERQMWHDKIAGTLVVKVPRDLVLP
jgi:uncharacterized RDD family membrane protein YckC